MFADLPGDTNTGNGRQHHTYMLRTLHSKQNEGYELIVWTGRMQVYDNVLASPALLTAAGKPQRPLLLLSYAEMELVQGNFERALHVALAAFQKSGFQPFKASRSWSVPELAAARQSFQAQLPGILEGENDSLMPLTAATVCLAAKVEWLGGVVMQTPDAGIASADALYRRVWEAAGPSAVQGSYCLEQLQIRRCRMLHQEAWRPHSSTSPSVARAALLEALDSYPSSRHLLQLLVQYEHRAHALSRLRRHLHAACQRSQSPQAWAAAVAAEQLRPGGALGVPQLFEKAVVPGQMASCPELWLSYMRFELKRGRGAAARRLLLRSLQECVWSKELWLFGLQYLGECMSPKELSNLQKLMQEKGLRVRVDIYETLLEALEQQQ